MMNVPLSIVRSGEAEHYCIHVGPVWKVEDDAVYEDPNAERIEMVEIRHAPKAHLLILLQDLIEVVAPTWDELMTMYKKARDKNERDANV